MPKIIPISELKKSSEILFRVEDDTSILMEYITP